MKNARFEIGNNIVNNVTGFVKDNASCRNKNHVNRLVLLAEESVKLLISHKSEEAESVEVTTKKSFGISQIILSCRGEKFSFIEDSDLGLDLNNEELLEDSDDLIRNIVLNKFSEHISYKYSKGKNIVIITEEKHEHKEVAFALLAMLLGILAGYILKNFASESFSNMLIDDILLPFRTLFVDALKMLIGPIVFLAMVVCISQFKSISEIGKIGIKLLGMYIFTTVLAVCIGFLLFELFPVGNKEIANQLSDIVSETMADEEEAEELIEAKEVSDSSNFSIKDMIVGIVPDNVISPFKESNLLQILFLAIFTGIGISIVSSHYPVLKQFFEGLNEAFMSLMGMLCKLIPAAIFANMICLVYQTGEEVLKSIAGFMLLAIGGIVCMMVIYNVLIILFAKLSPLPFIKKFGKTAITAFSLSSSTAAMPLSLESCKRMGISNKVASFAIPLGSTINMDGSSLVMSIACLYMARIFDIEITPALLLSILISVVLLSLGAPSMAGADLAIIAILISQIGVPVYAIALIMGIDTILDMMQAMSNTTGDAAVALIVARNSSLLDEERYYAD